jgi:ethanolamine utilization protein EutJ
VEVRAVANVVEAAGLRCTTLVDEPSAANAVLGLQNGAIVDVGGGTTGIAILSLVIAGAADISFEAAEAMKVDPHEQARLFPVIRPVMEKVANIVARHIEKSRANVERLTFVGGTSAYPGMAGVIEEYTGLPTYIPDRPVFVTPLGIAMFDKTPG